MKDLEKIQWLLDRGAEFHYEEREEYGPIDIGCGTIDCKECVSRKKCSTNTEGDFIKEEDFVWNTFKKYPLLPLCLEIHDD